MVRNRSWGQMSKRTHFNLYEGDGGRSREMHLREAPALRLDAQAH